MPNWCEMDFKAAGPKADLARFVEKTFKVDASQPNDNPRLDFGSVIPYPQKFLDMDAAVARMSWEEQHKKGVTDGFNSGGYEWCCQNWGTKWGSCNPSVLKVSDKMVRQTFQTAWSPPLPIITQLSKLYPTLTFTIKYFERGMAFQGKFTAKDGVVLENEHGNYNGKRGG